jgi:hypothetical protein
VPLDRHCPVGDLNRSQYQGESFRAKIEAIGQAYQIA